MGARGATSASEAADVVLMVDRLDRLSEALTIAQRTRRIAVESMVVGMSLSAVAMGFAAFGYLPPVAGAGLAAGARPGRPGGRWGEGETDASRRACLPNLRKSCDANTCASFPPWNSCVR